MKVKDIKPHIVWENDDYFIINKPPFISSLQDRNDKHNILSLAKAYSPDSQLAHRLDKETSGVLVIAKNEEAYRHISIQFTERKVEKEYHAVVEGVHDFDNVKVDAPIEKASGNNKVRIGRKGKDSVTFLNTIKSYFGYTLVSCMPLTGRMHQIRIHLLSKSTIIVGDELYGGNPFYLSSIKRKFNLKKDTDEEPLMKRLALHAFRIKFSGLQGEEINVNAAYPKDFGVLIKQLNKYG